ncbi:hypothetical protein BGP_6216 [Beggiatoa sp. PS]|nr:hypothetical protein BGP_6216 [Beggiatoa sp. PS]
MSLFWEWLLEDDVDDLCNGKWNSNKDCDCFGNDEGFPETL